MRKIFNTLLYWAFKLNLDGAPEWTSLVTLTILVYVNFFTVILLFSFLRPVAWLVSGEIGFAPFAIIWILIAIMFYMIYLKKENPKRTVKKYEQLSDVDKRNRSYLTTTYLAASFCLFFFTLYLKSNVY